MTQRTVPGNAGVSTAVGARLNPVEVPRGE